MSTPPHAPEPDSSDMNHSSDQDSENGEASPAHNNGEGEDRSANASPAVAGPSNNNEALPRFPPQPQQQQERVMPFLMEALGELLQNESNNPPPILPRVPALMFAPASMINIPGYLFPHKEGCPLGYMEGVHLYGERMFRMTEEITRAFMNSRENTAQQANGQNQGPVPPPAYVHPVGIFPGCSASAPPPPVPRHFSAQNVTNSLFVISAQEFYNLVSNTTAEQPEVQKSLLILDCRSQEQFNNCRVNHPNCVNVNIPLFGVAADIQTRKDVIHFVLDWCPELLEKLFEPGHYTDIVVMDERSTAEESTMAVRMMRLAMMKWNVKLSTKIKILEGGISNFSQKYPRIMSCAQPEVKPESIENLEERIKNLSLDSQEVIKGLYRYLNSLTLALETTNMIICERTKLRSLDGVKWALIREQQYLLGKALTEQIPDEAKCPVCTEIYLGEIFQCGNGHCVCSACLERIPHCGECRMPLNEGGGRVRNRALEKLMATTLTVLCPNCHMKLLFRDLQAHVQPCIKRGRTIEEVVRVEKEMAAALEWIPRLGVKLEQNNLFIQDSDQYWIGRAGSYNPNVLPNEFKITLEKIFWKKTALAKATTTLMSSIFLNQEIDFNHPKVVTL